jgi:glycosyltransferase involved in cell wall biosynthesis
MIYPTRADTSPNSVKEAVVAGLPVVASAVGGIPDYVWPGRNGILFPSGDLEACVNAIRAAGEHPLFSQGEVEEDALNEARDYLSPRRMGEDFLKIYQATARINR